MKLVQATNEYISEFERLESEFLEYDASLGIDSHYKKASASSLTHEQYAFEFQKRLVMDDVYFYFITDEDTFCGFIYGYIEKMSDRFLLQRLGYLDAIFISEGFRGRGFASTAKIDFFEWLANRKVELCQIHVAAQNTETLKIYQKWGFEVDQLRLTSRVSG